MHSTLLVMNMLDASCGLSSCNVNSEKVHDHASDNDRLDNSHT